MVLVSIPSVMDPGLAPPGKHTLHAYLPATEPFALWEGAALPSRFFPRSTLVSSCACPPTHEARVSMLRGFLGILRTALWAARVGSAGIAQCMQAQAGIQCLLRQEQTGKFSRKGSAKVTLS